jgi:hypothetical protein
MAELIAGAAAEESLAESVGIGGKLRATLLKDAVLLRAKKRTASATIPPWVFSCALLRPD